MDRKKLSKILVYLILLISIAHFIATKLYWYSSIWWFDMPMHFLGGFWIGLACIYLFPPKDSSTTSILKILFLLLFVGVGWEVFELLFNNYVAQNPFNTLDTISDIFFDLSGGAFAILYFFKRIKINSELPPLAPPQ